MPPSKSRKVRGYIAAVEKHRALERKAREAHDEVIRRRAALSGGQLAEATRLLLPRPEMAEVAP
jgi:hypothetical protein